MRRETPDYLVCLACLASRGMWELPDFLAQRGSPDFLGCKVCLGFLAQGVSQARLVFLVCTGNLV